MVKNIEEEVAKKNPQIIDQKIGGHHFYKI